MNIFFDLDGPILDVQQRHYQAYKESVLSLGYDKVLTMRDFWSRKRVREPNGDILEEFGMSKLLAAFIEKKNQLIESERLLRMDRIWQEVKGVCDDLLGEHRACLVTLRSHPNRVARQLEWLGIEKWFQSVLVGPAPPGTGRWLRKVSMIRTLGAAWEDESRGIFIGDTETDVLAGQELGCETWAVGFGIRHPQILAQYNPDRLFMKPSDLAGALRAHL